MKREKKPEKAEGQLNPDEVVNALIRALGGQVIVIWDNGTRLKAYQSPDLTAATAIGLLEFVKHSALTDWLRT